MKLGVKKREIKKLKIKGENQIQGMDSNLWNFLFYCLEENEDNYDNRCWGDD